MIWRVLLLLCGLFAPGLACAQSAIPPVRAIAQRPRSAHVVISPPQNFPDEPFVIEQYTTKTRFENNGTGEITLTEKIRVQNDAGAQQLATLTFNYNAAHEQFDVRYLRVRTADGKVAANGPKAIGKTPALEAKDATAYANYRAEQISVPALSPGVEVEYEVEKRIVEPAAPGEFWIEHSFLKRAIVLNENLEINVPDGRSLVVKSAPNAPYQLTHAAGRAIYRWQRSNLTVAPEDEAKKLSAPLPDVQVTSFKTWAECGAWYGSLLKDRAMPTPEIREMAAQLDSGRAGNEEKIRALYDYVSKQIRYVDMPLGLAGYQPRAAPEILSSGYGDAKDKNTLLAAMLAAAGLSSDIALLSSSGNLDSALPSPGQFDHVLTAAGDGQQMFWLDPAEPVIPFRMLAAPLRGKSALRISPSGPAQIVQTPRDPPFDSVQNVDIHGKVSALGKLTASVHYSLRGDNELALRLTFARTPAAQWKDLAQTMLAVDGIHADVTSIQPGDPASTAGPFPIDIDFVQENFLDWLSERSRTSVPVPNIGLPSAPEKKGQTIDLGSPLKVDVRLALDFPPHFTVSAPVGVSVNRDYADYKSSYQASAQTLLAERSLDFKQRQVAAARADDFEAFSRAITADENQLAVITDGGMPEIPADAKANDLFSAGHAALVTNNFRSALPLLERAVALDPQQKSAWDDLGLAYLQEGKADEAAAAFQKQLANDPSDPHASGYLGTALEQQGKFADAIAAFRKQAESNPLDAGAHAALAGALLRLGRDPEAAAELEKAVILAPKSATLQVTLGQAYLDNGDNAKALAAFERAAALSPTPRVWNAVAAELADHGAALDKAQEFARSALSATSTNLRKASVANPAPEQWENVSNLAIDWDTLGWVLFQKGDLAAAERYISAAWHLGENGLAADHLAQIYIKRGDRDKAARMLAVALAAPHPSPDARARLTLLLGGNAQIDTLVEQAGPELSAMRTWKLPASVRMTNDASGDFVLEFSTRAGKLPRITAVKQVSGSEALRPLAERLRTLDYHFAFPDAEPVTVLLRGTLSCEAKSGACIFVLVRPEEVKSR